MDSNIMIDKLKEQYLKLSKWKKELKENLLINNDKKKAVDIYLIRKKWLEEYERKFLNAKIFDEKLIKSNNGLESINNEKLILSQKIDMRSFTEFFPLNRISWILLTKDTNEKEIYFKGYYLNNILFLEGKSDSKSKLLWIFFMIKKII